MECLIRPLKADEIPLLEDFLYEAIYQRDEGNLLSRSVVEIPEIKVYIDGFGKSKHDHCLVAECGSEIVGAVWTRILSGKVKGYGNIDDRTPEFAISVYKDYRGKGIGTRLMREMLELLKRKGYSQTSLSVQKDNYAFKLYQNVGFSIRSENDEDYIMVHELQNDATIEVETPRLFLRRWKESDVDALVKMNADEEVMRYFPEPYDEARSMRMYDAIRQEFSEYGYGLYAVSEKGGADFIGFIGFHRAVLEVDFCPCIEIAWRLEKDFWNRGYATEGAVACLKHGFQNLGFEKVYSFTAVENIPSQRVMQKIGMRLDRYFDHPEVPENHPLRAHVCYVATPEVLR